MKLSFFDRLSGNSSIDDAFTAFEEETPHTPLPISKGRSHPDATSHKGFGEDDKHGAEGQLPVDVHQTADEIIIRAFVAGCRPDELSISIGRDLVEIEGSRMERDEASGPDYFTRELFWGSFSRTISLPQEIDVDAATATAKDGLLTITLPKIDRARQTKLRVKAG